ncbi:MAG: hypothetical protein WC265_01070, partial [Dysgonamonadaceae bacterium]
PMTGPALSETTHVTVRPDCCRSPYAAKDVPVARSNRKIPANIRFQRKFFIRLVFWLIDS